MDANPDRASVLVAGGGGFEIVQDGAMVWCFDRRTRGPWVGVLVAGGVSGILGINAIVMTALSITGQGSWVVVAIELGIALVAGLVAYVFHQVRKARDAASRSTLRPLVILDLDRAVVMDGVGRPIAPLAEVTAQRAMVITSSAPALVLRFPKGGSIEVFRGSLFGGGLGEAQGAFRRLGLR